ALIKGYDGIRVTGNTFWLGKRDWRSFADYEAEVDSVIHEYQMIAICTYSIDKCGANEVLDVVSNHHSGLVLRKGKWDILKKAKRKWATIKRRKPRDLMQIYADILRAASSGVSKSRLVSKANLNFLRFERILKVATENGLLTRGAHSSRVWFVTEKGKEFLKKYQELEATLRQESTIGL
ncbi:MAG: MEDS domain-containing protein, partial [Asgard group archaeon]